MAVSLCGLLPAEQCHAFGGWGREVAPAPKGCSPSKEYITVLEFLRSRKEWRVPETAARGVAKKVAEHCPGSAARMIRVSSILSESGVGTQDAIQTGVRLASESDEVASQFVSIFKKAYLQSELDLDISTSHRLASKLTIDLRGSLPALDQEFSTLLEFCSSNLELAQSKPRCTRFASELLVAAKDQSQGVSKRFRSFYEFLVARSGAELPAGRALVIAQELVGASESAGDSFIEGSRYATSPKGLAKPRLAAIEFARDLALTQLKNASSAPSPDTANQGDSKPPKS